MSPVRLRFYCPLLLALASSAGAQENPDLRAASASQPPALDQAVYKGLVGTVLDAIPMDPSGRLDLQRTNAVVSNTMLGRSLYILAGMSNPVLMVGGFVWGLWAASNIKPEKTSMKFAADPGFAIGIAPAQQRAFAFHDPAVAPAAADEAYAHAAPEPVRPDSFPAAEPNAAAHSQSRVIRIWLPQRAPALAR